MLYCLYAKLLFLYIYNFILTIILHNKLWYYKKKIFIFLIQNYFRVKDGKIKSNFITVRIIFLQMKNVTLIKKKEKENPFTIM